MCSLGESISVSSYWTLFGCRSISIAYTTCKTTTPDINITTSNAACGGNITSDIGHRYLQMESAGVHLLILQFLILKL